jgi:hypothetical protein
MTRIIEWTLLLSPLVAYVLWRYLVHRGIPNPSRQTLIILAAAIFVLGTGLVWTSLTEREPEGTHYVPAHLENGRVIPGHST